jgi:hypothetical protein
VPENRGVRDEGTEKVRCAITSSARCEDQRDEKEELATRKTRNIINPQNIDP